MLPICCCLLALISSGLAFYNVQPWDSYQFTSMLSRGNNYGASIGFDPIDIKYYPYMVSIVSEKPMFPIGAGAIINKNWILTMALTTEYSPTELKVYVGANNAGRSGQRVNVAKVIGHKKFSTHNFLTYNIALLKTETPIKFGDTVKPVKLSNAVPKAGANCSLLGYGFIEDKPYIGWELGVGTVQVKSKKQCEKEHGRLRTAYCADSRYVKPCYGDFGDPLMCNNKLVGFFVGGKYCSDDRKSAVYTNVPSFRKWIRSTIKANSKDHEMEGIFEDDFDED